jgi:hypothetical protein
LLIRVMMSAALGAHLWACASNEGATTIELTHDACAPLSLVAAAPTELQSSALQGGQDLWLDRGAPALGRRAGATLDVRFEPASPAFRGLYDDHEGVIYINSELTDARVLSIVVAHELGHAFGLVHVPASERPSLMNPGNVSISPTASDQAEVEALWGACK